MDDWLAAVPAPAPVAILQRGAEIRKAVVRVTVPCAAAGKCGWVEGAAAFKAWLDFRTVSGQETREQRLACGKGSGFLSLFHLL